MKNNLPQENEKSSVNIRNEDMQKLIRDVKAIAKNEFVIAKNEIVIAKKNEIDANGINTNYCDKDLI